MRQTETFACQSCESEAQLSHALGAQRSTAHPKKDPDASDALCGVKYALNQHIKSIHCGESSQTLNYLKGKEIFHLCHSELLSRALHGKTSSLCNGFKTNYTTQIQYCL